MSDIVLRIDQNVALFGAFSLAVAGPLALFAGDVNFQSGPTVGTSGNAGLYDFANGTVADAEQVNNNFSVVADAVNDNDTRIGTLEAAAPSGSGLTTADYVRSEGSTTSGSNAQLLSLTLDLTGMEGRWLHVYGSTALSENANTSNTSILRIVLDDGTPDTLVAQRQGLGAHNGSTWTTNTLAAISLQTYHQITAAEATSGVSLQLRGGVDNGAWTWGNQGSYTHFDGEQAGGYLGYAIY